MRRLVVLLHLLLLLNNPLLATSVQCPTLTPLCRCYRNVIYCSRMGHIQHLPIIVNSSSTSLERFDYFSVEKSIWSIIPAGGFENVLFEVCTRHCRMERGTELYIFIYLSICMYVYMYVCLHLYLSMYVCMYVCVYLSINLSIHT